MLNINKTLFITSLITGTLIAISSYSWMGMWMGLEINLLSFIPLMNSNKNAFQTESSIKYFLTQSLASLILLFSIIALLMANEFIAPAMKQTLLMVMNSSLLTKLGTAPFHFWFPSVMEGLLWMESLILLTWQKIAPMILIMNNLPHPLFLTTIILISTILSGFMGMNQISLRKIMVFSSINHMGWMLASMMSTQSIWINYFLIYTTISANIILLFHLTKSFFMKQIINSMKPQKLIKLILLFNLISMSGLPPFLGFFPKWMIIQSLTEQNMLMLSLLMIVFTLFTIFIYIRVLSSSLIVLSFENLIKNNTPKKMLILTLNILSSAFILLSILSFSIL
uniref:NADH-ubiquinone oxidoreductase chain 2 n=1 Tax=Mordellidae sp. 4 ACP-2013 TaxID=1434549 RepID=A0A3G3MET3_9CUCU|nr:NADH dehydrogenase subunit 2 [Mordellidae sp. 4 ACP-2013]